MQENRTRSRSTDPRPDLALVAADGTDLRRLPDGVLLRDLPPFVDDRGEVVELFDPRWGWHDEPLSSASLVTVRPGVVKGWNRHEVSEDRYAHLFGELEVVLYDERETSPTRGLVRKIVLTERRRMLMTVPPGVWHALRALGDRGAALVNFPTELYDHAAPDKQRLPLDSPRIPYDFPRGIYGY